MQSYSYKIVPAPDRARKFRGVKAPDARFARTLEDDLNALAADGWEFVRTETFEVEERAGLTGKKSVDRQVMVFRKALVEEVQQQAGASLRAVPDPEPAPEQVEAAPGSGPRILGRPVPPLSRGRPATEASHEPE